MDTLLKDLRQSVRLLGRTPGFSLAAILVLGLGIGLNATMFSLLHAVAFSPRPFPDAERVVQLYSRDTKQKDRYRPFSHVAYRTIAERGSMFDGVLAHNLSMVGIGEGAATRRSFSAIVSANYFRVLGVPLVRGRGFSAEEETPGREAAVTVVSHPFWRRTGFDPDLVGKTIKVNERPFTVIGIAPRGFTGTMMLVGPELYFPLGVFDSLTNDFVSETRRRLEQPSAFSLFVVARLKQGVSREAAREALGAVAKGLAEDHPVEQRDQALDMAPLPRIGTSTSPMNEGVLGTVSALMLGLTIAVLLVVCLNLAGLLLARGQARRRELAIRLALGGGRARIVRQLLTEGFVLALAGGALGLLLASWSASLLVGSLSARLPITFFFEAAVTPALAGATLFFCVLATFFFALGPALRLSRADVLADLKRQAGEDAAEPGRSRYLPKNPLVVAQVALSLGLLVGAGLFMRMARAAANLEMGFSADETVVAEVDGSLGGFDTARSLDAYRHVEERLQALPGVGSASIGALVPFGFIDIGRTVRRAGLHPAKDDRPATAAEGKAFEARWNAVGASYFSALGQPLRRGRAFTAGETSSREAPPVAIVDEVLAAKLWPEGDALGQRIAFVPRDGEEAVPTREDGERTTSVEVVGIVGPARSDYFEKEPRGAVYVPFAQGFISNVHFHVRPTMPGLAAAQALVDPVRRAIAATAPGLPVFKVRTFGQHRETSDGSWALRASTALFSLFGGFAMVVAVVGLYGSKAYAVSRRTREIGVRMALGARPDAIRGLILGEGLRTTLLGLALGLPLGTGAGWALRAVFVDVKAFDPLIFGVAATALLAAALLACWVPACRATRIAPMSALRTD